MKIKISWDNGEVTANLVETPTSKKLLEILPCKSKAQTWGDEVYFSVPIEGQLEDGAKQVVDPGTVCFWVEGSSLAIPFGPTPISQGDECRLVTKVNVLGSIDGDPKFLSTVMDGDDIHVMILP